MRSIKKAAIFLLITLLVMSAGYYRTFKNSRILSNESISKIKKLNTEYGMTLHETVTKHRYFSSAFLKADLIGGAGLEPINHNNGGIILTIDYLEDQFGILTLVPKVPTADQKLMEIADRYQSAIPEIANAEIDQDLTLSSFKMPPYSIPGSSNLDELSTIESKKLPDYQSALTELMSNAQENKADQLEIQTEPIETDNVVTKETEATEENITESAEENKSEAMSTNSEEEKQAIDETTKNDQSPSENETVNQHTNSQSEEVLTSQSYDEENLKGVAEEKPTEALELEPIHIAVIDSGIDVNHEIFSEIKITDGKNLINETSNVQDDIGHGTHVSGIIAKNSPTSVLHPYKVVNLNGGKLVYALMAINEAIADNVDVINVSFGVPNESYALDKLLEKAIENDIVVVAAAGNKSSENPFYPSANSTTIAVNAVDSLGLKLKTSNFGDWVDVSAYGFNVLSSTPNNQYKIMSGTSQATAFASAHIANTIESLRLEKFSLPISRLNFFKSSYIKK